MFPMLFSSFRLSRELQLARGSRYRNHRYPRRHLRRSRWRCRPLLRVLSSLELLWILERTWAPWGRISEHFSYWELWPNTDEW